MIELWGGIECSVIRVHDIWRDQLRETGHHDRPEDLDAIAALGIRTLRYPVLWERCGPGPAHVGWLWHDQRLARLRDLGITPIIGLEHHGSGPRGADPLSPDWPAQLAEHAARTAARYPWVQHWTPVNEPLTTARFGGQYGHWHPHARSAEAFHTLVLNQCRATLLAMRAIRRHIPGAQLVQTEDLGHSFATPPLQPRADRNNERRWLAFDLLCGDITHSHPATRRLQAPPAWMADFRSKEAAPDIIGINHYVTSDRFLDHRPALYPANIRHPGRPHIDTEAVRIPLPPHELGWAARLREAWHRYRRPIAITEAHLTCDDPAEPVRWLLEAWQAAHAVRAEGADIRAVTTWSLFGAWDWDTMLARHGAHYEPGAWDSRTTPPTPTPLAQAIESLAKTGAYTPPDSQQGWWRRPDRLYLPTSSPLPSGEGPGVGTPARQPNT